MPHHDGLRLNGNWAPRLGASWDPLGNGRSKIYGFWGRFYEAILLDMNIRSINGEHYIITQFVNPTELTPTMCSTPRAVRWRSTVPGRSAVFQR